MTEESSLDSSSSTETNTSLNKKPKLKKTRSELNKSLGIRFRLNSKTSEKCNLLKIEFFF